ncbi:hatching enzyme-like [Anneissia japonica]|uniref:hatching enzyme-like n=1 Tax=Anneissia japonica TaxID=1529436 RepID=UPI001425A441|nr:hatching enzyme-like [Anneissia japonica]
MLIAMLTKILGLCLVLLSLGSPADSNKDDLPSDLLIAEDPYGLRTFLEKYGYIEPQLGGDFFYQNISEAIQSLQQFANIPVTGRLDDQTLALLDAPRCGLPDVLPFKTASTGWPNHQITYSIESYTQDLSTDDIEDTIRDALKVWADVSSLTFQRVQPGQGANLQIEFGAGSHGDNIPFDGRGGVLAHAFLPQRGDAHFDDDENWTIDSHLGVNLFIVAAHEFGHSLGLYHSDDRDALMYPYYTGYDPDFQLGSDDIDGIRSLYGSPARPPTTRPTTTTPQTTTQTTAPQTTTRTTTTTPQTTPPTTTHLATRPQPRPTLTPTIPPECSGEIDAVITTYQGQTYAFRGKDCTFYRYQGLRFEFQSPLSRFWSALTRSSPGCHVDAVFTSYTGLYYFFVGSDVFKYRGTALVSQTSIAAEFPTFPPDLQTGISAINVYHGQTDGPYRVAYVFKGDMYYIMDFETQKLIVPHAFSVNGSLLRDWCHDTC